jgi:hypothetical protein
MNYICPVCGYDKLEDNPFDENGGASFEICSCCGTEFGYELGAFDAEKIQKLRQGWIKGGMNWFDDTKKHKNWNYKLQTKKIPQEYK